ncbi:MAG: response regulator [Geminicoccaceae bacterium]|nr:response regulator [Geminicoccaceae bacterium]
MARVLIADDDDLLVELVTFTLEGRGHEVLVADDGEMALERAFSDKPDLIVLDGMMPGRDGLEVLRELRRDSGTSGIPVIMLSARRQERDVVGGLAQGADDYLVKPFMPEELAVRVGKALRQRGIGA